MVSRKTHVSTLCDVVDAFPNPFLHTADKMGFRDSLSVSIICTTMSAAEKRGDEEAKTFSVLRRLSDSIVLRQTNPAKDKQRANPFVIPSDILRHLPESQIRRCKWKC